jgi:hypothetical protein
MLYCIKLWLLILRRSYEHCRSNIRSNEMKEQVSFGDVLELFESYGWKFQKIYEPYRVFVKQGELPWLIPVHDKKVDVEYVKKFKEFLEERGEI